MSTTKHLQILPDYYILGGTNSARLGGEADSSSARALEFVPPSPPSPPRCPTFPPKLQKVCTNPRYKKFTQIHFTAGDEQQFNQYRNFDNDKCIRVSLSNNMFKKYNLKLDWPLYHSLEKKYIDTTFRYIFNKFKKGIFVKIHSGVLQVFLPFSKANFTNEWSAYIKSPPEFPSVNEFIKYSCSLAGFTVTDSKINSFISSWYSNNCLLRHEFPTREGDSGLGGVKDMLEVLCQTRQVPDIEFFLNKRDFPILKRNLTEPYESLYNNRNLPLLSHKEDKYYPILSMTSSDDFADIPIPTLEDWARVANIEDNKFFDPPRSYRYNFNHNFSSKKPIALFRGASTGEGTDIDTNMRLKVAYLSSLGQLDTDGIPLIDAGITKWNTRIRKQFGVEHLTTIDYTKLPFGLVSPLTPEQQSDYKYIINIDGHCSAFRLSLEMGMGCVILLVQSKYKMWFGDMIKPWIHYVPVKSDLSDLIQQIKWCKRHDQECNKIVQNCLDFYYTKLSKKGILDYMQLLLTKLRKNMGYQSNYNKYKISYIQKYLIAKDLNTLMASKPPLQNQNLDNKMLDRGGIQIYKLTPNTCLKLIQKNDANNKYDESLNEIFTGIRCINITKQYIPNFIKIIDFSFTQQTVTIVKEWIDGLTLDDWIRSDFFNIQDLLTILLQINLSLFLAQSLFGFLHLDLYPWNIVISYRDTPTQINYPWIDGKMIVLVTNIIPYILDYGKSSTTYRGIRYGSLKFCTIHDTLTNLFSTLFEVIKKDKDNSTPILKLANFVSNTKFKYNSFKHIKQLKLWLRNAKKYDNMLTSEKYELSQKTPIDFANHIFPFFNNIIIVPRTIPIQPLENKHCLGDLLKQVNHPSVSYHLAKFIPQIIMSPDIDFNLKQNILQYSIKQLKHIPVNPITYQHFVDLDSGTTAKDYIDYISFNIIRDHLLNREIYFTDPKQTMAIYTHSTYKFYYRLLTNLNVKKKFDII